VRVPLGVRTSYTLDAPRLIGNNSTGCCNVDQAMHEE
jgi:hypothetical protein